MPQKSTERARVTLPKHVAETLAICAKHLEAIRLVPHTASDALVVGIDFCERTMPKLVKMLSSLYVPNVGVKFTMKVRPDAIKLAIDNARALGVTRQAYIDAISILFCRALVAQSWRAKGKSLEELKNLQPKIVADPAPATYSNLPAVRSPTVQTRRLKTKREELAMRYHKYIEDFRVYMQDRGGLSRFIDEPIALDIHAKPIKGNVGYSQPDDVPIEENAKRRYYVRIWKRGRGYNITVLHEVDTGDADEGAVLIPIGTVFRLYEIYRNINWDSITIFVED